MFLLNWNAAKSALRILKDVGVIHIVFVFLLLFLFIIIFKNEIIRERGDKIVF